jgi:uncharacterized membrane protein YgcG
MRCWTPVLLAAVLAAWLVPAGPARAIFPPAIKDDGKFFKPETLEKGNKKIREIYEKYKKDVVIETIPSLTADQEAKMKEEGREKFFAKLALDRARALGVNGIYIILCKKPTHLQVHMDPGTQKRAFTTANRRTLIEKMISMFKEEKFDEGLLAGLEVIDSALKANTLKPSIK